MRAPSALSRVVMDQEEAAIRPCLGVAIKDEMSSMRTGTAAFSMVR